MLLLCHNCMLYDYLYARVGSFNVASSYKSQWSFCPSNKAHAILISVSMSHKAEDPCKVLVSGIASSAWHDLESPKRWAYGPALGNYLDSINWGRRYTHCWEWHHFLAVMEKAIASILCSLQDCRCDNCFKPSEALTSPLWWAMSPTVSQYEPYLP